MFEQSTSGHSSEQGQAAVRTCSIDGCDGRYYGRGWCVKHYTRWKRHGDPLASVREQHGYTRQQRHAKRNYIAEYNVWCSMIQRCENPAQKSYHNYGGRGIKVCERWRESFTAFLADMGRRPSAGHTIERIDNDGNYEPTNCRWATRKEQGRNRRGNLLLTANGETRTLAEWSERLGCGSATIRERLNRGYSEEEALNAVLGMGQAKFLSFNGRTMRIADWARETGIDEHTINARLRRGWSVEKALTAPLDNRGKRKQG